MTDYIKNSNPLESIIDFAWANGADRFWVNNAKDELKKLIKNSSEMREEINKSHQFATEELNLYLEASKELSSLQKLLENPVAWAKVNDRGDLYDLRLYRNPYENNIIPLFMRPTDYEQRQQIVQSQSKKQQSKIKL